MNFLNAFLRVLIRQPHRALPALFWHLAGKKVRARNRLRHAARQSRRAYAVWIEDVERNAEVATEAAARLSGWENPPTFTVVITLGECDSEASVVAAISRLQSQCYPHWLAIILRTRSAPPLPAPGDARVRVATDVFGGMAEALGAGILMATGDYVLPLQHHAALSPLALLRLAEAAQARRRPDVLYGDHDCIDRRGNRSQPWFKPRWNHEMFLAQDYITQACAIRADAARLAVPLPGEANGAAPYALLLAVTARRGAEVVHVPHVLAHLMPPARHGATEERDARLPVVARHLAPHGAIAMRGAFGSMHIQWPLPGHLPSVSVIVPTRDKVKLLRTCIDGVLGQTHYHNLEVLIVDNGSTDPETLRYLDMVGRDPRVRVLPYDQPYNYSAINNFAVAQAVGDYVCLLNNDTEVLEADWLREMMRHAARPHVGAVGAKLLYADRSIQHAGVVVGMGQAAGHAHRYLRHGEAGYFAQAHIARYVSAVTGACLLVEKAKFNAVGGLDEDGLPIAFNDVDLCLKLERAGWRNVYTPHAVLTHHESRSRGKDFAPAQVKRYMRELAVLQARWGTVTYDDPLHHPRLRRSSETYVLDC